MVKKQLPKPAQTIHTGALKVTLSTNRVLVETAAGQKITIVGDEQGVIIQDDAGDSIQLQGGNIAIRATAQVSIQCNSASISALAIRVDAPMTQFTGVVQADTVIANTVIASTYTPGAGNIW